MQELMDRFGNLLAAHRRHAGLTQEALAIKADLSPDMISRLETGSTGARFPTIYRLASALEIDAGAFFTDQIETGATERPEFRKLTAMLSRLTDEQLVFVQGVVTASLQSRS